MADHPYTSAPFDRPARWRDTTPLCSVTRPDEANPRILRPFNRPVQQGRTVAARHRSTTRLGKHGLSIMNSGPDNTAIRTGAHLVLTIAGGLDTHMDRTRLGPSHVDAVLLPSRTKPGNKILCSAGGSTKPGG
jgi:hypothetical protein